MEHNIYGSEAIFLRFKLKFFIDNIKLENGRRGNRVGSQIYEEVVRYLKQSTANLDKTSEEYAEVATI